MFGVFSFDKSLLNDLLAMNDIDIKTNLEKYMKPLVSFTNETLKMDNITFPCKSDIDQVHCNKGKLLISKDIFDECITLLIRDIKNPFRREYILHFTTTPINPFLFTKKENEIINIYQI
jgi:hypothetical protein